MSGWGLDDKQPSASASASTPAARPPFTFGAQPRSAGSGTSVSAGVTLSSITLTRTQRWTPRCLPTYVPGFDNLIKGESETGGGLPLGSPAIVLFSGDPGSGKSTTCYNIVAQQLNHGRQVIFITFEKAPQVVMAATAHTVRVLGLNSVKVIEDKETMEIPGLTIVDMFSHDLGKQTIPKIVQSIQEWFSKTSGRLVVIDSITDMTGGEALPEAMLRIGLKNMTVRLAEFFQKKKEEISIVATSQHRGSRADSGIAGGMAVGHRSNAVLKFDSTYVNQFDKGYFGLPRGAQVRSVWVVKTADFAHSPYEHFLSITPDAVVTVGEPIALRGLACPTCGNSVDLREDPYVKNKEGFYHLECFEKRREVSSAVYGLGTDVLKGTRGTSLGKKPLADFAKG